jgi:hypothetical protein
MTRRTKGQWRELIEQQEVSGLPAGEFCRQNSLNAKYFSLRKRQLSDPSKPFVQVMPPHSNQAELRPETIKLRFIELDLPQQALLESLSLLLGENRQ